MSAIGDWNFPFGYRHSPMIDGLLFMQATLMYVNWQYKKMTDWQKEKKQLLRLREDQLFE